MSPSSTPLPAPARDVVGQAAAVVADLCDALREDLRAEAGRVVSRAKGDGTPVTDADMAADLRIRRTLREAFPGHTVISEEDAAVWDGREWAWVVDPIDGTSNFTAGIPYWSVSIALLRHGMPVYGCIEAPPLQTRFEAVVGEGARQDGAALTVREPVDFRDGRSAHVPVAVTAGTIRRAGTEVRLNARILGSTALDLAMVAAGRLVAAYQRVPKVWDVAAGHLLVTEATGVYVTLDEPALLPLTPDVDLAGHAAAGVAGPDEGWVRDLVDGLVAQPSGR